MSQIFDGEENIDIDAGGGSYSIPFTFACWIRTPAAAPANGQYAAIGYSDTGSANNAVFMGYTSSSGTLSAYAEIIATTAITNTFTTLSLNTWYHLAVTFHSTGLVSTITPYLNGSAETPSSSISVLSPSMDSAQIGAVLRNSFTNYFFGTIAECAVWTRVLSAEEIASLAAGFSPMFYSNSLSWYNPCLDGSPEKMLWGQRDSGTISSVGAENKKSIYPSRLITTSTPSEVLSSSVSQNGITWTFSTGRPVGQFVNGDWWVVGPVTVDTVSPGWTSAESAFTNGSEIDPNPDVIQQGFDSRINGSYGFNSSYRTVFPVTINPSGGIKSLVSTIGKVPRQIGSAYCAMDTAAVLTVVSTAPPAGTFRPPYVLGDKPLWNVSQIDYDLLPLLSTPSGTTLPDYTTTMTKVWLAHGIKVWGSMLHPESNMEPYPRDSAIQVSEISLLIMLDIPERLELARRMIQLGIDLYGMTFTNYDGFWAQGGFGNGWKWPILFAGLMLNDSAMQSPPKYLPGSPPVSTIHKFGEDGHTYYGEATVDYPAGKPLWGANCAAVGQNSPWFTNHDCRDPNGLLDSEDMTNGGDYRLCCTSNSWLGYALMARKMNAMTIWDHPAFFDYVDRWVLESPGFPSPDPFGTQFIQDMWEEHR